MLDCKKVGKCVRCDKEILSDEHDLLDNAIEGQFCAGFGSRYDLSNFKAYICDSCVSKVTDQLYDSIGGTYHRPCTDEEYADILKSHEAQLAEQLKHDAISDEVIEPAFDLKQFEDLLERNRLSTMGRWERFKDRLWQYRIFRKVRQVWRNYISEPWYYLKCLVWHRYNVIKIRDLSPTWHDRDHIMFHACMQIMVDFVEGEKPFDWFDTVNSPHAPEWSNLKALYNSWKALSLEERLNLEHEEQNRYLRELFALRGLLWT